MIEPRSRLQVLPSASGVAEAAAELFVQGADRAIRERSSFGVALSGGSTPERLFALLASPAWSSRVEWTGVDVFWGDERCVPPDHPDSNYGRAHELWLKKSPIPSTHIHRIRGELEAHVAAREYERELRGFVDARPPDGLRGLDLVFLGLGSDGHTASLFSGSEAFRAELHAPSSSGGENAPLAATKGESRRWVVENYVPKLDAWRVTLTAATINRAAHVAFLVTGASKASALRRVLSAGGEGPDSPPERTNVEGLGSPPERTNADCQAAQPVLPAQLIRPSVGRLTWLVDEEAASELDSL